VTVRTDSFVPAPEDLRRAFSGKSATELLFFARQCLERGGYDQVLALGAALGATFAGDPSLALTLGVARFLSGDRAAARDAVAALVAAHPSDPNALSVLAEMRARSGDPGGAVENLKQLIAAYPDYPGALSTLATLLMPGPSYRDVLRAVHAARRPRTYLEIGVAAGATLAMRIFWSCSSTTRIRPASSTRLTLATTMRPSTEIGSMYEEILVSPYRVATSCMCQ
jgi:hypothetical protein